MEGDRRRPPRKRRGPAGHRVIVSASPISIMDPTVLDRSRQLAEFRRLAWAGSAGASSTGWVEAILDAHDLGVHGATR